MIVNPAFVIFLTVMSGAPTNALRLADSAKFIFCDDQACVDTVVEEASKSPKISRLRVFPGGTARNKVSGEPSFPPILDLHFN